MRYSPGFGYPQRGQGRLPRGHPCSSSQTGGFAKGVRSMHYLRIVLLLLAVPSALKPASWSWVPREVDEVGITTAAAGVRR